jgi:hypothetical protein
MGIIGLLYIDYKKDGREKQGVSCESEGFKSPRVRGFKGNFIARIELRLSG